MTVSTSLLAAGAPDFIRQAILGHEQNQIINRHYTEANVGLLKTYLDRIDLGLEIERGAGGFPVISGCTLVKQRALRVTLHLDTAQRPRRIEVRDPDEETCRIIESDVPPNASDDAAFIDMEKMAIALAEAIGARPFRVEGEVDLLIERRLEMLLAIGEPMRAEIEGAAVLGPRLSKDEATRSGGARRRSGAPAQDVTHEFKAWRSPPIHEETGF